MSKISNFSANILVIKPGVKVGDLPDKTREVLLVGSVHDDPRPAVVAHHLHPRLDRARRGDLSEGEDGLQSKHVQ